MKNLAVTLLSVLAAGAQAQTVYREGSTYTDRPTTPDATRVYIVLNIVDSQPVPLFNPRPLVAAPMPAPAPQAPQTVINITVRPVVKLPPAHYHHYHYRRNP